MQLLYTLLLSEGPYKPKSDKEGSQSNCLAQTILSGSISSIKILNSIARISLFTFQHIFNSSILLQESIYHIFNFILSYSLDHLENSDDTKELLHETTLLIGYFTLQDSKLQSIMLKGEVTLAQRLFSLPFKYFSDAKLKEILMPTVICMSYENELIIDIVNKEVNLNIFIKYLNVKINLEPIVEEDMDESVSEDKSHYAQFHNTKCEISTVSSTNSLHDMVTGVSDFLPFALRFPRKLWEKALEFYSKNNK